MNEIEFILYGPIVGKQRPRFRRVKTKEKEFTSTYTPKKTKNYEDMIAEAYRKSYPDVAFPEGALEIEIYFYFQMPKSWSLKKKERMFNTPCMKKPDLDNCIKSVQDGLNGVAFKDDSQITDTARSCKRWSKVEYTIVKIRRVLDGHC